MRTHSNRSSYRRIGECPPLDEDMFDVLNEKRSFRVCHHPTDVNIKARYYRHDRRPGRNRVSVPVRGRFNLFVKPLILLNLFLQNTIY